MSLKFWLRAGSTAVLSSLALSNTIALAQDHDHGHDRDDDRHEHGHEFDRDHDHGREHEIARHEAPTCSTSTPRSDIGSLKGVPHSSRAFYG